MTDLQAAIGRAQLHRLDDWQYRREVLAAGCTSRLRSVPGLAPPSVPTHGRHSWHLYAVRVLSRFGMQRDELVTRLTEQGIGASVRCGLYAAAERNDTVEVRSRLAQLLPGFPAPAPASCAPAAGGPFAGLPAERSTAPDAERRLVAAAPYPDDF